MNKKSTILIQGGTRIYATDGSGRDTYIGFDNGGNTFRFEGTSNCYTKRGAMHSLNGHSIGGPNTNLMAKRYFYEMNGTGRDTYIHVDSGGFFGELPKV